VPYPMVSVSRTNWDATGVGGFSPRVGREPQRERTAVRGRLSGWIVCVQARLELLDLTVNS
jgi:hypothetical protein